MAWFVKLTGLILILCISILVFLFSCTAQPGNGSSNSSSIMDQYQSFKQGYIPVTNIATNELTNNEKFYIELQESAIPYQWIYITDNSNVSFIDSNSFDFNPPLLVGGPVQFIWRFRCTNTGIMKLTFYYQSITDTNSYIDTNIYIINIK